MTAPIDPVLPSPSIPLPELDPSERLRYARHLILPEVGPVGQRRLKGGRVLLIGAGGLGSPAALYLAAAGVGTIGMVDPDVVDATNLQRQLLHRSTDVGRPKLESARERIAEVNPHVRFEGFAERLTAGNALRILEGWDVVVDGSDNFPTRYLVNDACALLGIPDVYGAIHRFEGQVSVFDARSGPCYRCLFREPPPPGMVPDCSEAGVLGVLPGIIGSLQAMEAIQLLLGIGEVLRGRLVVFDGLRMRWREISLRKDPACPICGAEPTIRELIDYDAFCGLAPAAPAEHSPADPVRIEPAELHRRLEAGEPLLLVDVREGWEWEEGNLSDRGALHIPVREFEAELPRILGEAAARGAGAIVVLCRSGGRSARALRILEAARPGVALLDLRGGLLRWREEIDRGLPVA